MTLQAIGKNDYEFLVETIHRDHGPQAAARVRGWFEFVGRTRDLSCPARLQRTNQHINEVRYTNDHEVWQKEDHWATPLELLIKDAGDCEDFAVAKYFTLIGLDIADSVLRITYARVNGQGQNQPHMVLAWYESPDSDPLILDNIEPRIMPASQRPDLIPVYSFNGSDLWLARSWSEQIRAGDASTLSRWQELRERFAEQLTPPAEPVRQDQ